MKKIYVFLLAAIILVGCTNNGSNPEVINTQGQVSNPATDITTQTCKKESDGTLSGDCPVDEFGHPYVPKVLQDDDYHDDTNTDPHLHDNDHEHADDTPPHRH